MNRIRDKKIEIEYDAVRDFWKKQVKNNNQYSVMLQKDTSLAEKRDKYEKDNILPYLMADEKSRIFDVGCGTGRWAEAFKHVEYYLGIDYVEDCIERANKLYEGYGNIKFKTMSATDIDKEKLQWAPSFNIIIINGLMVYLNDTDCENLMEKLLELADQETKFYIRESVSITGCRLSLKDFYSEELETNYNAIYRTPDEYRKWIDEHFLENGFKLTADDILLKGDLVNRVETNQYYFFLERV